jgi:hypothetical protein
LTHDHGKYSDQPPWSAEAFPNLVRHKESIRGFVFDVATGKLHEVA